MTMSANKRVFSLEHRKKISEAAKLRIGEKNHMYGKKHSKEFVRAITGSGNHQWKGDNVGYAALHDWLQKRMPKPDKCSQCNRKVECGECHKRIRLELANITGVYKRDLENWKWLCTNCHRTFDGCDRDPMTGRFLKRDKKRIR